MSLYCILHDDIVCLWQNLLEYDKQRVKFAARHQDRMTTERFRTPKKKVGFTPGVDSLNRCVLGSTASPAQWPDCCRLVEAIFIRLCGIHLSPRRKGRLLSRWSLNWSSSMVTVSESQPTLPCPYHRKVEANTCRKCGHIYTLWIFCCYCLSIIVYY